MSRTCIIIIVINLLVLGGAAIFIAWLADPIKFPTIDIDQAAINNFNLTKDNVFSANFTLIVRSHNRDSKYTIFYDHLAVSVYHNHNYSLAFQRMGHFAENDTKDDIVFTSNPTAKNVVISEKRVAEDIRNEIKSGKHVELDVMIRVYVVFEAKGWKRKKYLLKMICFPVVIDLVTGKNFNRTSCNLDNYVSG